MSLLSTYVLDNKVLLCSLGCNDCLNGICTNCKKGYTLNTYLLVCNPCPAGCQKCGASVPACLICYDGNYNYNGVCRPCMATCTKCSTGTTCD